MHTKRIIDYVIYNINCNKCELRPKNDKGKGEGKEEEEEEEQEEKERII